MLYLKSMGALFGLLFLGWIMAGAPLKSEAVQPRVPTSVCDEPLLSSHLYVGATFDGFEDDPNGGREEHVVWVDSTPITKTMTKLVPMKWTVVKMNPGCFSMDIVNLEHPNQVYHQSTSGWW